MSETNISLELNQPQSEAWDYVTDKVTTELLFGGGAGGGKTVFIVSFAIWMCLTFPGIRGFIGRQSLEDFKKSTLLTMFDMLRKFGLREKRDFEHNQAEKRIRFVQTGSDIYYNELGFYPTDPDYNYLGSQEYTFGCIDEANQVDKRGKNVLRTRIRYRISEYGLVPKLVMGCNPDKGYLRQDFYRPWREGTLPPEKKFVQALATQNSFIDATYVRNLEGMDDLAMKERLLYGNWDYDNDPSKLMDEDAIHDIFTNALLDNPKDGYITADIARQGQDKTVVYYWEGFALKDIRFYEKLPLMSAYDRPDEMSTEKAINDMRSQYGVPLSRVLVDEDGMGGGVKDRLGCKGFLNGSRPLLGENYANLKTQCYYKLAKKVMARGISVSVADQRVRDWLIQELEQVRSKNADRDGRLQILGKDDIKQRIGRSPDFSDALAMRMWFELFPKPGIAWI